MRRSKFVELVSASLDGELSKKERELLQKELATNLEHRALYASYKRMNKAVASAEFPLEEAVAAAPVYKHSFAVSTVSWCVAGAFASVMVAFFFVAQNRAPSSLGEQYATVELGKPVVVTNETRPSLPAVEIAPPVVIAQRTPINELVAASSPLGKNAFPVSARVGVGNSMQGSPLDGEIGISATQPGFAPTGAFPQSANSLYTPVSFAPMADH